MSNQEILEKAINNAIDGGWKGLANFEDNIAEYIDLLISTNTEGALILNHDFAKALWGEEIILMSAPTELTDGVVTKRGSVWLPAYQAHLQSMVIAENQIKYLGENT